MSVTVIYTDKLRGRIFSGHYGWQLWEKTSYELGACKDCVFSILKAADFTWKAFEVHGVVPKWAWVVKVGFRLDPKKV